MKKLYTIGYSPHTHTSFQEMLRKHGVNAVVDVRSGPYSARQPEFNRNQIERFLKGVGVTYVFLGDMVGARFEDPAVYVSGRADYERIAVHPVFHKGLDRIRNGSVRFTLALMCAEKDPLTCHRAILVSRILKDEFNIFHILEDGSVETHSQLENRLLRLHSLDVGLLPGVGGIVSELEQAYNRQGQRIAFVQNEDGEVVVNG